MINNEESTRRLLQSIIDNTNNVIYIKHLDGTYALINNKYEEVFEISKKDVIGKTDYDLFEHEIAKKFIENDKAVEKSLISIETEERAVFKGREIIYLSNKFPVFDAEGEMIGICGISTDITKLDILRKSIEASEENYKTLVSNIQGVVYRCATTTDWKMFFISDYIHELSGYPAEDFIMNNKRTFASIIHPDDEKMVENTVFGGLERRESYRITYRIIHEDGSVRWVHEKGCGYYEPNDEDAKYLDGVIVDITAVKEMEDKLEVKNAELLREIERRKRYESELKQLNDELEERIEERTLHLKRTNELLQDTVVRLESAQNQLIESRKMVAIGSLVKGICHKINTPLGNSLTISTYIRDLVLNLSVKASESELTEQDFMEFLEKMEKAIKSNVSQVKTSIGIIEDLKMISESQIEHKKRSFNLNGYLDTMLTSKIKEYQKKNIEIKLSCDEELEVQSFPGLIFQVITLLLVNSEVHGFEEDAGGEINVVVYEENNDIVIEYSDDGKGMEHDVLKKIYDPFFTTKMGRFSGLGLYTVYTIVTQKLHGSIHCDSVPDEGVTFTIRIPK